MFSTTGFSFSCLILAALSVTATVAVGDRMFAYMETHNAERTKTRTHVFALTTAGSLAHRFTSRIDEWRQLNPEDPYRYNRTLSFPSPLERTRRVERLYEDIVEYNQLVTTYFRKRQLKVPEDHLMIMNQRFGLPDDPDNQYLPTRGELNRLHEKFALLLGPGQGDSHSPVWGDWNEHLHTELTEWLGVPVSKAREVTVFNAKQHEDLWKKNNGEHKSSIVLHMFDLLEDINTRIHAVEAVGPWAVHTRFTFNNHKLGPLLHKHEMFLDEDYEPSNWHMAMEMGGMYMAYAKTGKNLYACMVDNDIGSLEHHQELNTIQFQEGFYPELYTYWGLGNETEASRRQAFKDWWQKNGLTSKYGWEFNKRTEPNGFIRLGQQVCDPPSDCDKPWLELLDAFSETPLVSDIRFSTQWPYGKRDEDLRYLYPGDEAIMKDQVQRWWPLSMFYTPTVFPWNAMIDDMKGWWFSTSWPWSRRLELVTPKDVERATKNRRGGWVFSLLITFAGVAFTLAVGFSRVGKGPIKKYL